MSNLNKDIKTAEIRLAMFISEHNIALRTSDHLVSLFKSICPESNVVKSLTCNRTKATAITTNVIGLHEFEDLIRRMKTQSFSILIDESTDKSSTKHLAVVSRMVHNPSFNVRDEFVKLIEVSDASAKGVYDAIIHFFNSHDIPYKQNLAGFASDGANVMFGSKHSVKSLLEHDVPHLFVIKCLCHSLALCASYACEKLPNDVENLVHEVYNYMKFSSKRQNHFQEFQEFLNIKPYKLLQPSQTRWLALQACVKRMVDIYKPIKLFFQVEYLLDNKATTIYHKLNNPVNEFYLHFLNFILPVLTNINIEFQSQNPKIHCIYSSMERTFKTILECYMNYDYIKNTATPQIQYRNPSHFLSLDKIYLGAHCMAELSKDVLSKQNKDIFLTNCLNFLVECSHQFYKRFPFNSKYVQSLKHLGFLDPKNMDDIISISPAASEFQSLLNLDLNELDSEWRILRHTDVKKCDDVVDFWRSVKLLKKGNDQDMFPNLNKLVTFLFTLPHSSAATERIFSAINLNKTKSRNRLSTDILSGLSYSKNLLNSRNKSCYNFDVEPGMIKKFNSSMYNKNM